MLLRVDTCCRMARALLIPAKPAAFAAVVCGALAIVSAHLQHFLNVVVWRNLFITVAAAKALQGYSSFMRTFGIFLPWTTMSSVTFAKMVLFFGTLTILYALAGALALAKAIPMVEAVWVHIWYPAGWDQLARFLERLYLSRLASGLAAYAVLKWVQETTEVYRLVAPNTPGKD